jgi:hypothetical protein
MLLLSAAAIAGVMSSLTNKLHQFEMNEDF